MPEPLRKIVPSERGEAPETRAKPQIARSLRSNAGKRQRPREHRRSRRSKERLAAKATAQRRCQGARAAPRPRALDIVRAPAARADCRRAIGTSPAAR